MVSPAFGEDVVAPTVEEVGKGVGGDAAIDLLVEEGDEARGAEPFPCDGSGIPNAEDEGDGEEGEEEEAFPGPVTLAGPQALQVGSGGPTAGGLKGAGGFMQSGGDEPMARLYSGGDEGELFKHTDAGEKATGCGVAAPVEGKVEEALFKGRRKRVRGG